MPQVKGLHLPKVKGQAPLPNVATPVARHRRRPIGLTVRPIEAPAWSFPNRSYAASDGRVTHYCGYIGATSSLPKVPLQDQQALYFMRREGEVKDGRIHTPGHKPTTIVVDPRTRTRKTVTCHDRVEEDLD